jgi:Large polyvalent protein associated domain 38
MPIRATLFNGRVLEFPDDTPPEVVERVAQEQTNLFRAQERPEPTQTLIPAPTTPPSRSAGEVVADIGASALSGLGSVLAFPGQVVSLVPGAGGAGRALAKPGEAIQEFAEGLKSEGLKVREALRSQAISEAEKEGILSSFATAITSTLKDPALIGSFVSEQLPLLLPPLAAARVAQALGRSTVAVAGRGLTGEAAAAATQRAAEQVNRRAYAAALGTGAAMQGADISSDAYKRAYDAAISQGMSPDDAESAATNAARLAGAGAAGVSLLTQRLPGARAIEERFARLPGSAGRIKAGLGEATAESLEEAGGALFQNLGVRTVDPNAQLLEGVGSAAGLGALGGGIFGTLLGKKGKQALAPGQMEGESIEQTINRLVAERAALTAPTAPALPTALDMIEMVNKEPEKGYSTIVKFIDSLQQLPDSPEKAQALQTAEEIRQRLSVEDIQRQIPTNRNVISGTDLQNLGFGTQDPIFQQLNGKDLAKPDQAVDVLKTLETELAREDLTGDRYQTLTGMMESVNAYLDQLPGSGFYAGEIEQPGVGERAPVAEPTGREPAETAGPVERGGVAPAGEPLSESALAKAESTAPLEFETKTGDVYSVDEQGRTSSKKAPGVAPREVLYIAPDSASALVDAMRVREATSVRLGYRDGNIFKTVTTRSEIPQGKQPIIGVINALDQMINAYPAQINPAVGFTPIEQVITSAGKASTKIGNPITDIRRVINKDVLTALGIKPASARGKRLMGKDIREVKKSLKPEELEAKFRELETRAKAPAKEAPAKPVKPEEVAIKQRIEEIDKQLAKLLKVVLNKYGLNDVGVELAKDLEANGEYANRLIRLADNHENPLLHLRHESIHALKELGFFTPKQWQTLEQKAKDEWVNTYLKNVKHSDTQSRYDAYIDLFKQQGKTQAEADQALIEEAIADAFSYFQKAKPPAGFLASINNRLKNFFKAIKEFLGSNNLTAEDIFGKIEAGELKPAKDKNPAPAAEPPKASLRGVPSIDRERSLNAKRISPRFPTAVKATEEVLGPIRLQPDLETFKRDPVAFRYNIGLMSQYPNFTDIKGTPDQRAEQIINRMRDNLLWLYKHWDENLRNRSKLWYVGGNRIAHRWAEKYGIPPETAAAIIASLSPQKDWFQNVSLAERTLDALIFNADTRWDASMDRVFKERAWTKKFPVKQYRGKTLKEMYVPGDPKSLAKMAVWIRAWDEGHNPQTARVITPEGTFTNEIASGKTGKPIAMRAQSFAAMVKTLQILQDSDLRNFSELIGKNHKVRSFYNNIIAPFAGEDVTIDTHAVAAALMRPLGSSDLEVYHNFGSAKPAKKDKEGNILVPASKGTKNSAVTGLYGTYAMYAEAYRRAAADARILPREMQSITWEAIRGLFRPEQKQAKLKKQVDSLWNQVAKGKLSGQEALEQISKLVSGIEDPAWVKSPAGSNDSRTDSSYATELPGTRVPGREPGPVPSGTGERAAGAVPKLSLRSPLGFYSALMDGIQSSPTTSAPASGWQAQIKGMVNKGQVKQDEVEWSTINDYLDLRTGKVSKDDLLNYLKAEGVQVEQTKRKITVPKVTTKTITEYLDEPRTPNGDEATNIFQLSFEDPYSDGRISYTLYQTEPKRFELYDQNGSYVDDYVSLVPAYLFVSSDAEFRALQSDQSPKYEKYTLPGGTNYQEVLLTLPTPVSKELKQLEPEIRALGITEELGDVSLSTLQDADASKDLRQRFFDALSKEQAQRRTEYISSHWNEPNVLAHIRLKDRTDANGNKVLFVEEIQSDWGQEGKKKGFTPSAAQRAKLESRITELSNQIKAIRDAGVQYPSEGTPVREVDPKFMELQKLNEMRDALQSELLSSGKLPPVAPFVTKTEGWLNLALKRVIVMASEGGYEKVAFVNGEQSADRYDLSKQIGGLYHWQDGNKYGVSAYDLNDRAVIDQETYTADQLEDYVGQEIAQKIINREGTQAFGYEQGVLLLQGDGLKIGGEGMKAFYDTIIPTAVKKLLPKVGGKQLQTVEIANNKQPGFDVTPEMRAKVEKGLPLFSLRSKLPQQSLRNTIPASTWNRVNMTIGQRNQKTWVQRITDAISPKNWSDFRTNALNRYEGLARIDRMKVAKMGGARLMADQSAEAAALFSDLGAGISAAAFGVHDRIGGYPVFRNGVVTIDNKNGTVKGPLAIFAPLAAYNDPDVYRLYQFWVTAQRGQRLNAEGRQTPFDAADMAEVQRINNDPQLGPMFRQIKDEWIKYNDGLVKFMEDTGVITPEASKEFRIHGDYFPMYKYMEQEDTAGPRVFSSIANVPVPKKLKGDEVNPMGDFFENVVRNTQSAIQMGIKNIAAQRATQVAVDVGSAVKLPGRPTRMEPNYYRVLENGKEVFYASSDVMFLNAIKSLQLPDLPFIGFLAAPANILRNLVTKTPDFMGANMLRDSVAAWVSSGTDITPIISTLKNFGTAIAEKSPELNALRNAGILGGYDYAQGVDVTARKFAKDLRKIAGARTAAEKAASPFTSIWEALEKSSSASDAATRMEVYKKTLAETGNEAEALFRALEVMNFNRKGRSLVVRVLTATVPFLNARMQGLDVLYRAGIRPILAKWRWWGRRWQSSDATAREQEIAKTFWKRGMTLMALSAMYWALTHDDDEYKKQEQETRDNNWLFPSLGIKIPIPFEIGVIFKVVPERVLEYSFGSDTGKDFVDSMTRQLRSTFAFNLTPQIVLPIYEVQTNHSFFTERPIIGQGLEQVAAPYQVAPTTSRTAQGLAKAYNSIIEMLPAKVQEKFQASPMVIDYLIQGYTGTMGTYAMQAIDAVISANSDVPSASKRFEQMPVIKRFALDPQARGTVTAYYDLKNSVDEVVRTSNLLERTAQFDEYAKYLQKNVGMLATKEYVSDLEKSMKEIREMKTMIRISTLSADAKRQQLDNVEKLELALTANIQKVKKSL